ncbi:MAG TPA: limonene-1,2-epoxide hydrolase family protein [Acidimicrobiales bacterium]|nr:limonene-1,2-epoxide hydrolase family protein [Acidimicrobiales bacterium]
MTKLEGRVAFISGGARGQGRSHAAALAREGCHVAVFDIAGPIDAVPYPLATPDDVEETVRLVEKEGRRCLAITGDVRSSEDVDRAIARTSTSSADSTCESSNLVCQNRIPHPAGSSEGTMTPGETVTAFIQALTSGDVETARSLCHEDLVFENVPLEPRRQQGRDAILAGLGNLVALCTRVEWEVPHQMESGASVANERIDRFWFDDGIAAEVPVMARWDVIDGRIALWRDYYDLSMWDRAFPQGYFAYMAKRTAAGDDS